jgi:glycerol-3-phosphate O-acyltransferase
LASRTEALAKAIEDTTRSKGVPGEEAKALLIQRRDAVWSAAALLVSVSSSVRVNRRNLIDACSV